MRKSKNKTFQDGIPWKEINFERQKEGTKNVAKCLLCEKVLKNIGYKRLLGHRKICKKKLPNNSDSVSSTNSVIEDHPVEDDTFDSNETTSNSTAVNPAKESTHNSDKSVITEPVRNMPLSTLNRNQNQPSNTCSMTKEDEDLAKLFFGCNIPFTVVEADYFINYSQTLNPRYIPPSRKVLSDSILNKMYQKVLSEHSMLKNEACVLLLDGWKNSYKNEKYVVGLIHNARRERLFLNAWDFTEKSETALTLKEVVEEACKDAREKYDVEIYAVVSDNVSTMSCMGKMIDLWYVTCNSHSGNLLAKGLVQSSFTEKVVMVLKEFKFSHLERKLVELGGRRISLPGDTRWCSFRYSYRCHLQNLPFMRDVLLKDEHQIKAQVAGLVLDERFEEELLDFIIIFDGICELVNKCQSSDFNIADALEEWLNFQFPLCNEAYESLLKKRLENVIKPIGLAANLLHPVYKGKVFAEHKKYTEMANQFLKENLDDAGLRDLDSYQKDEGIFLKLKQKKIHTPETFWSLAESQHPQLSKLARLLMKTPSSTAAIERLFSQWSFVHSKLRNRLTTENSKKLIHLYYTLHLRDLNKSRDY